MKKLLLLACLAASCSFAQPQITWHRIYDTTFTSSTSGQKVVQLFDSSYSVFGVIQNYYKIVHLSQLGDTLWTKTMNKNLFLRSFIKPMMVAMPCWVL